jgi:hypothetical protein
MQLLIWLSVHFISPKCRTMTHNSGERTLTTLIGCYRCEDTPNEINQSFRIKSGIAKFPLSELFVDLEMKQLIFIALCVAGGAFAARLRPQTMPVRQPEKVAQPQVVDGRQLPLAELCDAQKCAAPHCRCSQQSLDFDKTPIDKIPQLVMLTFDDAVTSLNAPFFEEAINGRTNPDGCPVAATFYVSHEYTDYSMVHNLWSQGHEIALHSIT